LYTWDLSDDDDDSCALCGFSVLSVSVYERYATNYSERKRTSCIYDWYQWMSELWQWWMNRLEMRNAERERKDKEF
jgi:hypothetical protein